MFIFLGTGILPHGSSPHEALKHLLVAPRLNSSRALIHFLVESLLPYEEPEYFLVEVIFPLLAHSLSH